MKLAMLSVLQLLLLAPGLASAFIGLPAVELRHWACGQIGLTQADPGALCLSRGVSIAPQLKSRTIQTPSGLLGLRAAGEDISINLKTPLGIVFEEIEPGQSKGLVVADLVPGGNADKDGRIFVGDKLVSCSAVFMDQSKQPLIGLGGKATTGWKREMIPCGNMGFEDVMNAIKSNSGRWGYDDCRIVVRRTDQSVFRSTTTISRSEDSGSDAGKPKSSVINKPLDKWEDQ